MNKETKNILKDTVKAAAALAIVFVVIFALGGDALAQTPDIRAAFALQMQVTQMEGPRIGEVKIAARASESA